MPPKLKGLSWGEVRSDPTGPDVTVMWLTASSCLQSKVGNFEIRLGDGSANGPETHHMTTKRPRGGRPKVDGSLLPDLAAHLTRPGAKRLRFHNKRVSCTVETPQQLGFNVGGKGQTRPVTTGPANPPPPFLGQLHWVSQQRLQQ